MTVCPPRRCPAPTGPPGPAGRRRGAVWGLLAATATSVAANAMVAVLVPWLILTRTGSAAQAGLVGAVALAAAIPALIIGGPLIDRWGRRAVSTGADLLSAVAVVALPVLDVTFGLSLVTVLAAVGVGALFDGPGAAAREVARPQVALDAGLPTETVNARGEAMEGVGNMAGPALAGAGIGLIGAVASLWFAALLFLLAAVVSWRSLPGRGDHPGRPVPGAAIAGLRVVARHPTLRAVAVVGAAGMACVAPLILVLADTLAATGDGARLGAVTAALAAGSITGALVYGAAGPRVRRRTALVSAVALAGAGVAAMAALSSSPLLVAAAAAAGIAVGPVNPVLAVVTQDATDPAVRGRVVTVLWSVSLIASPASMAVTGVLLDATGPVTVLLIIAAGLVLTAAGAAGSRGLRRIERDDLVASLPVPTSSGRNS